jgi:mono/diheme cytochrome c family protein
LSRRSAAIASLCALVLSTSTGCWEQWSETWFPQMKWQKAVQAFERVEWQGQVEGFSPPEGTVPVGGVVPNFDRYDPAVDGLQNPTDGSWRSLQRGEAVYLANCSACHGMTGSGDGPVSAIRYPDGDYAGYDPRVRQGGPIQGVFPLIAASGRSDGYLFNIIRNGGGRMPNYRRIPDEDRWHLVNYVRYLQRGGQP